MSDDQEPLRAYVTARKEFEEVAKRVLSRLGVVYKAVSLMRSYPHAFLGAHFNRSLAPDSGRPRPEDIRGIDMAAWPDLPALRAMFEELHGAFVKMHAVWGNLPAADQQIMKGSAPPERLSLG